MNVLSRCLCSIVEVLKPVVAHIAQTGLAAESDQSENSQSQCQLDVVGKKQTPKSIRIKTKYLLFIINMYILSKISKCLV